MPSCKTGGCWTKSNGEHTGIGCGCDCHKAEERKMKRGKLGFCCSKCGVSICDCYGNRIIELEKQIEELKRPQVNKYEMELKESQDQDIEDRWRNP